MKSGHCVMIGAKRRPDEINISAYLSIVLSIVHAEIETGAPLKGLGGRLAPANGRYVTGAGQTVIPRTACPRSWSANLGLYLW